MDEQQKGHSDVLFSIQAKETPDKINSSNNDNYGNHSPSLLNNIWKTTKS